MFNKLVYSLVLVVVYLILSASQSFSLPGDITELLFKTTANPDLNGDPSIGSVFARLQSTNGIAANFSQRKDIKVLSRPLQSQGMFWLVPEKGVVWQTQKPIEQTYIITAEGIFEREAEGKDIQAVGESQPAISGFSRAFISIFSGGYDELKNYFDVYFYGTPSDWAIGVKPKDSWMAKAIASIVICGAANVEKISILEKNGDRTEIILSDISSSASALTEVAKEYFKSQT